MRNAAQNSHQRSPKDADQNSAVDLPCHEDESQGKSETSRLHLLIGEASQANEGSRVRDHQFCVAQPNEGNEHSNARSRGVFKAVGHTVDDLFAHPGHGQQQEYRAGKENYRQRGLPRNMHAEADGISEVRVQ